MKHALVARLRCPISGGALRLHSFETEVIESGGERIPVTKEGLLLSDDASVCYPVHNYVPVMLVFRTAFHDRFVAHHAPALAAFSTYRMPDQPCERGETFIQNSFTEEWNLTQDDALSFLRTHEDLVTLNRHVWLPWIETELGAGQRFERILNVGCGIGKETMALREVACARETFAVDLNFALLQAGPRYRALPDVQFVISSLFRLPFPAESFDFVYSQGVIHHTWSTQAAFRSIASFVRPGGYLFTWVYGLDDHLSTLNSAWTAPRPTIKHFTQRGLHLAEHAIRPWLSRMPAAVRGAIINVLSLAAHPLFRMRVIHKHLWKITNTRHSLRDLLTPAYAFRHSMNEVVEWYESLNFRIVSVQSAKAHKDAFAGKRIHGIGMTGRRAG